MVLNKTIKFKIANIYSIFILLMVFVSCEKDDICAETTTTTPQLIISFYDAANPENKKAVSSLRIYGLGDNGDTLVVDSDRSSRDSILIPLRTRSLSTSYTLIKDSAGDDETGNSDFITIDYETNDVFVSRACGYKTVFNIAAVTLSADADHWISQSPTIEITTPLVENELNTHVKIYH